MSNAYLWLREWLRHNCDLESVLDISNKHVSKIRIFLRIVTSQSCDLDFEFWICIKHNWSQKYDYDVTVT